MRNIWNRDIYRNSRRTQSPPAIHNPKTKWALYTGLQVYEAIILIIWPYPHVALTSPSPSSEWKKPYVAHQTVTVKMNTLCSKFEKCAMSSVLQKKKEDSWCNHVTCCTFISLHTHLLRNEIFSIFKGHCDKASLAQKGGSLFTSFPPNIR